MAAHKERKNALCELHKKNTDCKSDFYKEFKFPDLVVYSLLRNSIYNYATLYSYNFLTQANVYKLFTNKHLVDIN